MKTSKGLKNLLHDAVELTTNLVQEVQDAQAAAAVGVLQRIDPLAEPARAVEAIRRMSAAGVFGSIRGINRLLAWLGDLALDKASDDAPTEPVPMRSDITDTFAWLQDAAVGAINGSIGDHLQATGNPLDMGMQLRVGDDTIEPEGIVADRVAVFVHGLTTTEWCWVTDAAEHYGDPASHVGERVAAPAGFTPVYVRYNTGRHISDNGAALSELLSRLECSQLVLVGHSMGGLVIRSACHQGRDLPWTSRLTHVICLATPHKGAPLEKATHLVTSVLGSFTAWGARIPARVANGRSAGIKDLRHGNLLAEDWQADDPDAWRTRPPRRLPLLDHVHWTFVATTLSRKPEGATGRLFGDGMVRQGSARGPHDEGEHPLVQVVTLPGIAHHKVPNHPLIDPVLLEALTQGT